MVLIINTVNGSHYTINNNYNIVNWTNDEMSCEETLEFILGNHDIDSCYFKIDYDNKKETYIFINQIVSIESIEML